MTKQPVLFVFFNRIDVSIETFKMIRDYRPTELYLACDGPRNQIVEEFDNIVHLRKTIEDLVDWDCNVYRKYEMENLGCGKGVSSAISWAFEQVERLIIIEDDCKPNSSFFDFCELGLKTFETNKRIAQISGFNVLGKIDSTTDLIFSSYPLIWGWATWKDRWENYELRPQVGFQTFKFYVSKFGIREGLDRFSKLRSAANGKVDTWDYQWTYVCYSKKMLSVVPRVNLISNIGFGEDATHTKFAQDVLPAFEFIVKDTLLNSEITVSREFDSLFKKKQSVIRALWRLIK